MNTLPESPVRILDLDFQGVPKVIASFLIESDGELGIIETGPTSTLPRLLRQLEEVGGIDALRTVVVTHIHLDHAGAVGQLLRRYPRASCYVHKIGAPHLIDPSRLLRSASRIYGNQMERLWGEIVPAPEDRVISVGDGDIIPIGTMELRVVYTPGHASHHIALFDSETGALFTGDVAGVRIEGQSQVRPPTPPPDIDLPDWHRSVDKLLALDPRSLYLTHYGKFNDDIRRHFSDLLARLEEWAELVRVALRNGQDRMTIVDTLQRESDGELVAAGVDARVLQQYSLGTPYGMTVDGLVRYLEKVEGVTAPTH